MDSSSLLYRADYWLGMLDYNKWQLNKTLCQKNFRTDILKLSKRVLQKHITNGGETRCIAISRVKSLSMVIEQKSCHSENLFCVAELKIIMAPYIFVLINILS